MANRMLIIASTQVVRGAEIVLGDYLRGHEQLSKIDIYTSSQPEVGAFFTDIMPQRVICSTALLPCGASVSTGRKLLKVWRWWRAAREIKQILRQPYKIVLGNNTGDIIYARHVKHAAQHCRFVQYIHDMVSPEDFKAKLILKFDRYVDLYIAVSKAVKRNLLALGLAESKICVIYNGVSCEFSKPRSTPEFTIGFVGSLEIRKSPLDFLVFFKTLRQFIPNARAVMVYWEAAEARGVREYIAQHQLPVTLYSQLSRTETMKVIGACAYLMVPSRSDPFPTVILEAFSLGVPVIGRNIDGIVEMIEAGVNGYLFGNSDEFRDLAERICKDWQSPFYQALSDNARATLQKFSSSYKQQQLDHLLNLSPS